MSPRSLPAKMPSKEVPAMRLLGTLTLTLVAAALAVSALAQPGRPGPVPDAQFNASVAQWASQLVLESQQLRDALTTAPTLPLRQLASRASQFNLAAMQFHRLVRTNPGRERLRRDFQPVDRDLTGLVAAVRTTARAERQPNLLQNATRLEYTGEQLSYWLGQGDAPND